MTSTPDPGEVIHHWRNDGWLACCQRWAVEVPYWHQFSQDPGRQTCQVAAEDRAA